MCHITRTRAKSMLGVEWLYLSESGMSCSFFDFSCKTFVKISKINAGKVSVGDCKDGSFIKKMNKTETVAVYIWGYNFKSTMKRKYMKFLVLRLVLRQAYSYFTFFFHSKLTSAVLTVLSTKRRVYLLWNEYFAAIQKKPFLSCKTKRNVLVSSNWCENSESLWIF